MFWSKFNLNVSLFYQPVLAGFHAYFIFQFTSHFSLFIMIKIALLSYLYLRR